MRARSKRHKHFVAVARREWATDEVEIDNNPKISPSDDGCWIAAWVWVSNATESAHDD